MVKFTVTSSGNWKQRMREKNAVVAEAAVAALEETAENAVEEGRKDIASAGRFGPKWQQGLRTRTIGATRGGVASLDAKALIFHRYGIASVFEFGAIIEGKPLLWIPTTEGGPSPKKSGKKLVSVKIAGKAPMLFDAGDKARDKKPLYIGVPSVQIPKKWHIAEIVEQQVEKIGLLFIKHFKDD
jgi:hypothetical protein